MTTHSHAIVWLDHKAAKIIFFNADNDDVSTVRADPPNSHIHSKAGSASGIHLHGDPAYFAEIARKLTPAQTFLVVGPSSAKDEFEVYLRDHDPETAVRMAGLAPQDKESDRQLLAFARSYFQHRDRMTPQR
jgi:hypothetical protein